MLSVVDAINASSGYVRPMREGEQLMKSGMIVSVGKKAKEGNVVHVQSLVLRTSGIGSKDPAMVELWIDVTKDYGERIVRDNEDEFCKLCDCPAGRSDKCRHIIAVMLCLTSIEEDELEDLSCTDLERQWGSLKKTTLLEFEAKPLSELCHVRGQRDIYVNTMPEVTSDMEKKWKEKLLKSESLSECSIFESCLRQGQGLASCDEDEASLLAERKHLLKRLLTFQSWRLLGEIRDQTSKKLSALSPELQDFYTRHVATTLDQSVQIISAEHGTPEWTRARRYRLTASKARAQFTYYVNKKADWTARYKSVFHSSFKGDEDTARGLTQEPHCREKYEERFSCYILESGLLVRPELPWLASSLDGTVVSEVGQFANRNIEIKTFKEGTRLTADELVEMNAVPTLDQNGNIKKKTDHYAQMQILMLLSGMAECDYVMWSTLEQDFAYRRVEFDEVHVRELCAKLIHVYFDEFLPRMMAEYGNVRSESSDEEVD